MTDTIPYTHWAYFADQAAAEACGRELGQRFDCLPTVAAAASEDLPWLLRAARTVAISRLVAAHAEVREVVQQYGGSYDGGESGRI